MPFFSTSEAKVEPGSHSEPDVPEVETFEDSFMVDIKTET